MSWLFTIIIISIIIKLYYVLTYSECTCDTKLVGKVAIVTGSNCGIGFETAKNLARRGARVILACRDNTRGKNAQEQIIKATGNSDVEYKHLDLSSLASVRAFADNILSTEKRLDILINNAGAVFLQQKKTTDGLILEVQINHFGPFLLTNLLLPALKASAPSRIINVSSGAHWLGSSDLNKLFKGNFSDVMLYCDTKLWNILFTRELSKRLERTGVVANSLNPGAVATSINRNIFVLQALSAIFFKSAWKGAQTSIHLAVSPECEKLSGKYFSDCAPFIVSWNARSFNKAEELWKLSTKAVNLKEAEKY